MDKASKALRRSGVRLRSIGSGHSELNLVISELKDLRTCAKAFLTAQQSASFQLLRWAQADENKAVQDTFGLLAELNSLWTDVQKDFTEHLKEFKTQFELILEGEKHVDNARNAVIACDLRENKLRKELKKTVKKGTAEEVYDLEKRMYEAVRAREVAQLEVDDRVRENEAVKLIRVKESLLKISESYLELAHKCNTIYEAHRDIAYQLPDVHDKDLQDVKYTGYEVSKQAVHRAKENVHVYRRRSHNLLPCAPQPEDPPPPYSVSPPYNPNYRFAPPYDAAHAPLYPPLEPFPGPSTSYDIPDGPVNTFQRNAVHSSSVRDLTSSSHQQNQNRRTQSTRTSNSNSGRRSFFQKKSSKNGSCSNKSTKEGATHRPHSLPGPSTSTNPPQPEDENRRRSYPVGWLQAPRGRGGSPSQTDESCDDLTRSVAETRIN